MFAIQDVNRRKAPGEDGIVTKLLKFVRVEYIKLAPRLNAKKKSIYNLHCMNIIFILW